MLTIKNAGWIGGATNDNNVFPDSTYRDLMIATQSSNQHILIGYSNGQSVLDIHNRVLVLNGDLDVKEHAWIRNCHVTESQDAKHINVNTLNVESNALMLSLNAAEIMGYNINVTNELYSHTMITPTMVAETIVASNLTMEKLDTPKLSSANATFVNSAIQHLVASNITGTKTNTNVLFAGLASFSNAIINSCSIDTITSCNIISGTGTIHGILRADNIGVKCLHSQMHDSKHIKSCVGIFNSLNVNGQNITGNYGDLSNIPFDMVAFSNDVYTRINEILLQLTNLEIPSG